MEKVKDNFNKEYLLKEYIENNKTVSDICEETGLSKGAIEGRLRKYNIYKDKDKIQESKNNRNLKILGVKNVFELKSVQEKIKSTNINKYGSEYPMQNKDIFNKYKITMQSKYGVDIPAQSLSISKKIQKTREENSDKVFKNKCSALKFIQENNLERLTIKELSTKFNLSYTRTVYYVNKYNLHNLLQYKEKESYYEDEICDILNEHNIKYKRHDRAHLSDNKEIDIYLPDYNFGIEFNGSYWHSEKFKDKYYHFNKTKDGLSKGIFIFNIYEQEWITNKNNILKLLELSMNKVPLVSPDSDSLEIDIGKDNFQSYKNLGYKLIKIEEPEIIENERYTIYNSGIAIIKR